MLTKEVGSIKANMHKDVWETVLEYLDAKELRNVHQVCSVLNKTIISLLIS